MSKKVDLLKDLNILVFYIISILISEKDYDTALEELSGKVKCKETKDFWNKVVKEYEEKGVL